MKFKKTYLKESVKLTESKNIFANYRDADIAAAFNSLMVKNQVPEDFVKLLKGKLDEYNAKPEEVEEGLGGALLTGAAAGGAMALANKAVGSLLGEDGCEENLASDIRKNNLDYDDEIDALYKKDGDTEIQFQDRETHYHDMKSKSPRTSSHTWGRVWKNGKLDKSFDGSKYEVRQNMAKYLDSKNESFRMKSNIPDLEEVAQIIWSDFQPDKMGEENWIEFDNDEPRKMLGTNNETMSFEAIGPNSKVRGAMRTQGNRIHVAIRNGSEGVFDSVDEIEDFIKGALEGFGK